MMEKWIKKGLLILGVAFVLFFFFSQPERAAEIVKRAVELAGAIPDFFTALMS